ncbi:hypothetical protein KSF_112850 [Reticulibacter mediterranei]|uniref:Uncharacterized protein n=1 Tax=Reticulibacter mediterranei TaxID=2778369 RepID=A0A8J3NB91_9CHLR|nr:hypothetical protein [Reticulibacter mediterranei]GHO97412.1 hypothetical protein KSF_074600 [Reticulibacter mediterranei]GHP01238.1 hypothetical protein KSF_112850 [Reticulibacter mediterranei]
MKITDLWTRLAQFVLAVNVLFFVGTSMVILFSPHTFQSIVQFVPFNRHYLGDAGIFQLAVSLGLLWALPDPSRRVAHIWIGTIASLMHTTNHVYDLLFVSTPPLFALWLPQTLTLLVLALSLLIVAIGCSRQARVLKRTEAGLVQTT